MPLALRDLQAAFAAHVMGGDRADLVAAVVGDTIPAAARLASIAIMSSRASAPRWPRPFPRCRRWSGADFFRGLARAFVGHALPLQPVLAEYGADFPAFIAGYEAARDLPYLADVARLDWALNLAFHAPLGDRLKAEDLSAVPVEHLPSMSIALAAGAVLVSSRYPLDRIWEASQPGASSETVDLNSGGRQSPRPAAAGRCGVRQPECRRGRLRRGAGRGDVARSRPPARAFQADPAFDLSTSFARLLALGAFAALQ